MFNPKPKNDPCFHGFPRQCIWLKINGSWPLKSQGNNANDLTEETGENLLHNFGVVSISSKTFELFYKLWSYYVILSVGITIYFQTAFLINTFGDIIMTTENCCTTFMGALNFVRLIHLRTHQDQFKDIIAQFIKDIWIAKNTNPKIEKACERNMRTFRIMTILLSCLISMYCILPLVLLFFSDAIEADDKPFPYKMIFPFDAQSSWHYPLTYCFTALAGIFVVTTLFAEDSIFGFFITYTCGQFRLLHENIDTLIVDAYDTVLKTVGEANATPWHFQREYVHRLNIIAFRHNKLIEFAKRLENFFNPTLLVNFVISSILICMVGFQLVTGKDMFVGDYVKFIVYITSSLSQLYILCWNGDTLIQHSLETANHLFNCNWEGSYIAQQQQNNSQNNWKRLKENFLLRRQHRDNTDSVPTDKEFRKNLEFMILCSQRPVKITAFKFSTVSLQSFTAILSTSMSYFTLLQTLYNDQDQEN